MRVSAEPHEYEIHVEVGNVTYIVRATCIDKWDNDLVLRRLLRQALERAGLVLPDADLALLRESIARALGKPDGAA